MTEIKKLLHADVGAETYSYEIEETAEHLTVAHLSRDGSDRWKYEVIARRSEEPAAAEGGGGHDLTGEAGGFATPDEAIAAARAHARRLLAAR